jgi:hypothetical protein
MWRLFIDESSIRRRLDRQLERYYYILGDDLKNVFGCTTGTFASHVILTDFLR